MKKTVLFIMVLIPLALTACINPDTTRIEPDKKTIPQEIIEEYKGSIEDTFNSLYWNYDSSSLRFSEEYIPENEDIVAACADMGFDIKKYIGKKGICASCDIKHYNGESAGRAYLFFRDNSVIGGYYESVNGGIYSLNSRNVYTKLDAFTAFESDKPLPEFDETEINGLKAGFSSEGSDNNDSFMTGEVDRDGNLTIVSILNGKVYKRPLKYDKNTLVFDCAVSRKENKIAVLVGHAATVEDDESTQNLTEKIDIWDKNLSLLSQIPVKGHGASFVGFYGSQMLVGQNGFIDYYEDALNTKSIYLGHNITDIKICDLDGNGSDEYVITDGFDIYIYSIDDNTASLLWRTNISVKYFDSNIYTGDLNGDGISEIYISDNSGCGIQYTLTPSGMKYRTIEGGYAYYTGDFNFDGKTDYIKSSGGESVTLCMAK